VTELAVTDTHALFWHATGRVQKLGRRARRFFERVDGGHGAVYVPTLVLVEIAELAQRGIFRLSGGMSNWVAGLFGSGRFLPADVTVAVVAASERMRGIPDRMDRLIAATAAQIGVPLITRDAAIAAEGVAVLW
jgi:PIN domain nuclease of toxin-antitoxin system